MKHYQFSLETLLSFRRDAERRSALLLSEAVNSVKSIDQKIKEQNDRKNYAFTKTCNTLELMRLRENIWHASVNQIKHLKNIRENAAEKLEKAQANYNEAYRNRQSLERLSNKRKIEWNKKRRKRQEIILDDLSGRMKLNSGQDGGSIK